MPGPNAERDRIAQDLCKAGIAAEAMHGNKSQSARQRTLASFKSDRPPVLVATDLAARGIDVDGVSHVFNYDLPHEPETYVHRIGRTGRAGAMGIAVAFCDHDERADLKAIERLIRRTLPIDPDHAVSVPTPPAPGGMPTSVGDRPPGSGGDKRHTPRRRPEGSSGAKQSSSGHNPDYRGGQLKKDRNSRTSTHR